MNTREYQNDVIDLKDLFFAILLKWRWIIAGMVCLGILAGVYSYMSMDSVEETEETKEAAAIEEEEEPLSLQEDVKLRTNIENLYEQRLMLEEYEEQESSSVFTALDAERVDTCQKIYVITADDNEISTLSRLLTYYTTLMQNYDQEEQIAAALGGKYDVTAADIDGLITVDQSISRDSLSGYGSDSAGIINLQVIGPDRYFCEKVVEMLDQAVADGRREASDIIAVHDIVSDSVRYAKGPSKEVQDAQITITTKKQTINNTILSLIKAMDDLDAERAEAVVDAMLSGMTMEAADAQYMEKQAAEEALIKEEDSAVQAQARSVDAKNILLGILLGAFLVCVAEAVRYVASGKLHTADELERVYRIDALGRFALTEMKPFALDAWLLRLRYGREYLDDGQEAAAELLGTRVELFAVRQEIHTILVTGTADKALIDRIYDLLQSHASGNIQYLCGEGNLESASELRNMAEADAVLTVERLEKSSHRDIRSLKKLLQEQQKKILGAVVYC